jgi:hypothetical protein
MMHPVNERYGWRDRPAPDNKNGRLTMRNFLRPALLSLSLLAAPVMSGVMAVPALADGADNRPVTQPYGYSGTTYEYGHGYGQGYGQGYGRDYRYDRHFLSEDQVRWRLRHQGFHRIHDIDRERGRYTARARDAYGRPVHVVVSARTGQVLHVRYR